MASSGTIKRGPPIRYITKTKTNTKGRSTRVRIMAELKKSLYVSKSLKIGINLLGALGQRDRTGDLWNNLYDQTNNRIGLWNRYAYDPTNRKNLEISAYINHDFKNKQGKWKFLINNSNGKRNIEGFYNEMHYQADSSAPIGDPILQQLQNTENNNI